MPDPDFTELASARLVVRRFCPADVDAFVAYRSDPLVARYQSWDAPYPRQAGEQMIAGLAHDHPDTPGQWFQFAVALRSTSELIGDLASFTDADDDRQAEIGFTVRPGFQGQGYATEAARLMLAYLFGARGKHRVRADCDARNAASAAVLERIGMRREGWLRESSWFKGEWTDDLLYAMLDHEWAASQLGQDSSPNRSST
jgi:RimJ/RimL family protein N-acetyltransferase